MHDSDKMIRFRNLFVRIFSNESFPPDAFFIEKVFHNRPIIVYGAGESFHYFKEVVMRRYGYMPAAVIDLRFSTGDTFEGIPAYPPHEYHPSDNDAQNAIAVICLGNRNYFAEAFDILRQMGFRSIISLNDIYEIQNPFSLPAQLESEGFGYYASNRGRIESCLELFADDMSREVYLACIETHLTRKPVVIPSSPREEQYTPSGFELKQGYERWIYCGVSVGEMRAALNRVGRVGELVCFEPDPNQFRLTVGFLAEHHGEIADRVTVLPCAVYSHEGIMPFTFSDTSFGSRILSSGNAVTQAVSIDRILPGFRPSFISMDIEGAELEALKGAEQTVRKHRPDLAICVYHSPSHLWEIPQYLHSLGLGYRFYMRNYTSLIYETVLYAAV